MNTTVELVRKKAELTEKGMTDADLLDFLGNEFPGINTLFEKTASVGNIYRCLSCFAHFTRQMIQQGNFNEVKHCFKVAERITEKGNNSIKNALYNTWLFSLGPILDMSGPVSEAVRTLLTNSLKKEYLRQVHASGI